MINTDVQKHIRGESIFLDDLPVPEGTLYCAVLSSNIAHGKILSLEYQKALESEGVVAVLTSKDIPGQNQVGGIIQDETLLADENVHFIGEPLALVIAEDKILAEKARELIKVEYDELTPIFESRKAFLNDSLIQPPKTFESGRITEAWSKCDFIIEGTVESGGQEHLYLETQGAMTIPKEGNSYLIYSSTQSPTAVQRTAARILGLPMNNIEVDVQRLGGAFGGKEDQATHWAVLSCLGSAITGRPVKLVLNRKDDLRFTGKRHPYSSDFKIGITKDLKIIAYEVTFYQNAGAVADLSPAILERTLFHATNAYFIPNVKATAISCRTNLIPNTAFRGFGGPQGKFVIESAIQKAAEKMKIEAREIQKRNLLKENDHFYYGQKAESCKAGITWEKAELRYDFNGLYKIKEEFNRNSTLLKKGLAVMPICFGISFTSSFLNQASALVHIYTDGSVGVSTAAVEMGQGVNEKIKAAVAQTLSIDPQRIRIESTNTTRIANSSATAASSGADLNANAAIKACRNILERLSDFAMNKLFIKSSGTISIKNESVLLNGEQTELKWKELISQAYFNRINLSSHEFYATPDIYFDRTTNKGHPFAYHVYGTSITGITLDCARGIYEIDFVKIVHDFGKSIDYKIDLGQTEGGVVQGIGWLTLEEIKYDEKGELLSNSLSTYKVPDIYSIPKTIEVEFLSGSENRFGPLKSKAIGEPPLMYGIGSYFAILDAMRAFRPHSDFKISAPLTPEKVLLDLYESTNNQSRIKAGIL